MEVGRSLSCSVFIATPGTFMQDTQAGGPDDLDALSAISRNKKDIWGSEYISVFIYWYLYLQLCTLFLLIACQNFS